MSERSTSLSSLPIHFNNSNNKNNIEYQNDVNILRNVLVATSRTEMLEWLYDNKSESADSESADSESVRSSGSGGGGDSISTLDTNQLRKVIFQKLVHTTNPLQEAIYFIGRRSIPTSYVSVERRHSPIGRPLRMDEIGYVHKAMYALSATRVYMTPGSRFRFTVSPRAYVGPGDRVSGVAEVIQYIRDPVYERALFYQEASADEPHCRLICRVLEPVRWWWFGSVMYCEPNDTFQLYFKHYTAEWECRGLPQSQGARLTLGLDSISNQPIALLSRFCGALGDHVFLRRLIVSYLL